MRGRHELISGILPRQYSGVLVAHGLSGSTASTVAFGRMGCAEKGLGET
jgi:hypothetical protein